MSDVNERAAKDCEFYGHRYVGASNCVYCNTPQSPAGAATEDALPGLNAALEARHRALRSLGVEGEKP
jgi:hypothetical protein